MSNLSLLYEQIQAGTVDPSALIPQAPALGFFEGRRRRRENDRLFKAIGEQLIEGYRKQISAATQGVVTNASWEAFGAYDTAEGVQERTEVTFRLLRQMAAHCEPANAIIETRARQVAAFCQRPDMKRGYVKKPGLRVRLTVPAQQATAEDKATIELYTDFVLNCGWCDPPRDERPLGWQRGLKALAAAVIRDTLTMDAVAVRRWGSQQRTLGGNPRYPIVCFAAEDAGRIRRVRRPIVAVKNGVPVTEPWQGERRNNRGEPIAYAMVDGDGDGGAPLAEYTERELAYAIRNMRTDRSANGYGYSELERCINAITIWIAARQYNSSRFREDALPRGILIVMGNLNEQQFQSFQFHWQQMLKGSDKHWNNPILKGTPQQGAGVQWLPIDMSSRDMEYHQFMFSVALWIHALFGIHPEETGFEALSPFRPPLSEASPETKLEYSQDSGFAPLLLWFQDFLNTEILWKLDPSRRYMVEFMGLGQGDEMADIQLRGTMLQLGLTTPRRMLAELDEPVPDLLKDDPAMDMLGPWFQNRQLLMAMQQAAQGAQMQQQQMQQAQEQHEQQLALNKVQAFQQMQQGQAPPGGPGEPDMAPNSPESYSRFARQWKPMSKNGSGAAEQALQKALLSPWN